MPASVVKEVTLARRDVRVKCTHSIASACQGETERSRRYAHQRSLHLPTLCAGRQPQELRASRDRPCFTGGGDPNVERGTEDVIFAAVGLLPRAVRPELENAPILRIDHEREKTIARATTEPAEGRTDERIARRQIVSVEVLDFDPPVEFAGKPDVAFRARADREIAHGLGAGAPEVPACTVPMGNRSSFARHPDVAFRSSSDDVQRSSGRRRVEPFPTRRADGSGGVVFEARAAVGILGGRRLITPVVLHRQACARKERRQRDAQRATAVHGDSFTASSTIEPSALFG